MFFVETPGVEGRFQARIVGIIVFGEPQQYRSKRAFYADFNRHLVDQNSIWAWKDKPKWGWPIEHLISFATPRDVSQKRGIVFTQKIEITVGSKLPFSWSSLNL
jgi:hypothetical protein